MFFVIDHVLVSFVTIATTGAIFSLQFTKKTVWRPGSTRTRRGCRLPSCKTGVLLLREGEEREEEIRGKGRGIGGEEDGMGEKGRGQERRGGGNEGRGKEGAKEGEKGRG